MKKIGFLIMPILVILVGTTLVPRFLAGGANPTTLVFLSIGLIAITFLFRPKKAATKSAQQVIDEILDDYCRDAFADNDAAGRKYLSALADIGNNLPKTALGKLEKLEAQCVSDKQTYAVALAAARCHMLSRNFKKVIRHLNKAIVLHPTADVAYRIGDCHQRLGELDKAKDSYEFAMELDPANPQYPSSIATACVGDGCYSEAINYALDALAIDENFPQALATLAICYGLQGNDLLHKHYFNKAVDSGYKREKIEEALKALKSRG